MQVEPYDFHVVWIDTTTCSIDLFGIAQYLVTSGLDCTTACGYSRRQCDDSLREPDRMTAS